MKVIKAAMLGMGSVNQNLLKILTAKKDCLAQDYGIAFQIVAATDSSGIVVNDTSEGGFDMMMLVRHKENGGRLADLLADFKGSGRERVQEILQDLEVDLLFEATPCDASGDSEALTIVRAALTRGVSVVLANKGPLVQAISELRGLASTQSKGSAGRLEYSATVCGGLPILNIGTRDMVAGKITKLEGVFNATSNFIVGAMARTRSDGDGGGSHRSLSFAEAVQQAQDVGAAEANPSLDTGGWDTAYKLLIIANTIMTNKGVDKSNITLEDIAVEGIDDITADMILAEEERGNTIKLVATASAEDGTFSVKPVAVRKDSFLGSITGWEMGVAIHSDIYGISYHKLYEKEPIPTAASMMRDAVTMFGDS